MEHPPRHKSLIEKIPLLDNVDFDSLFVIADFDGTLTTEYVDGKKTPSLISILRSNPDYLSPDYQAAAHELYKTYAPYETDMTVPLETRKEKMTEWWTRHTELLIASGLKKSHLEIILSSNLIGWRAGAREFLELMHRKNVPVIIISASGLGEVIPLTCARGGVSFPNMHYLVNSFVWDNDGRAIKSGGPIIHSLNKNDAQIAARPEIIASLVGRTNALLLGNNVGDRAMAEGFAYSTIGAIGFLDASERERAEILAPYFDAVIIDDGYTEINSLLARG